MVVSKPLPLVFQTFGEAQKPPLIILHGFFASARNWRSVAKRLSDKFYVYVLDLRNHGESPHSDVMDYPAMSQDLLFFMDQQGLLKANILGHSMGGKVAMWFALQHSQRLLSLVIADISPKTYVHSFDATIRALQQIPLAQITIRKEADNYLLATIKDSNFRQFLLQNLVLDKGRYRWRINLPVFSRCSDNIVAFPRIESELLWRNSVLFLGGAESTYLDSTAILKLFPNAVIDTIQEAGHWLHAEQPDLFCERVLGYLEHGV
ncbi:MAG: alpha/beta fold hydrolase [Methylococcales bacterium]|jgi:pimeloyl-ACP methyl ester carboxylesterase|nr:alpha/beta fold hydrolase [Methylococcales bacterium]